MYRPDMDASTNFTVTLLDGGNNDQDVPSVSEGVRAQDRRDMLLHELTCLP